MAKVLYLKLTRKGIEDQGKVQGTCPVIQCRGAILQVEEKSPQNQGHNDVENNGRDCEARISFESSPATPEGQRNLLEIRPHVRRFAPLPL